MQLILKKKKKKRKKQHKQNKTNTTAQEVVCGAPFSPGGNEVQESPVGPGKSTSLHSGTTDDPENMSEDGWRCIAHSQLISKVLDEGKQHFFMRRSWRRAYNNGWKNG